MFFCPVFHPKFINKTKGFTGVGIQRVKTAKYIAPVFVLVNNMYKRTIAKFIFSCLFLLISATGFAQQITGVWEGKIGKQKVEVKLVQNGDSIFGTSYYYESANNYRRYNVKGHFDNETNEVVWWDDRLVDEKGPQIRTGKQGVMPLLSRADFNCPGGGVMMLDGKTALKENEEMPKGEVHLNKTGSTNFEDEWDNLIDGYTVGSNDTEVIDSVAAIAAANQNRKTEPVQQEPKPEKKQPEQVFIPTPVKKEEPAKEVVREKPVVKTEPIKEEPKPVVKIAVPVASPTIEEKFTARKKILTTEIPVTGDSIELRFYDNAEVDGDSISLFLNDKLIFNHIRLTGKAYVLKLAASQLSGTNELVMVAENLGSIPPNTSYMVATDGDKKYEAFLASTENSSALIRLVKKE